MPKGSDDSWAQKMYNTLLKEQALFKKPKLSNRAFIIHHFGEEVQLKRKDMTRNVTSIISLL